MKPAWIAQAGIAVLFLGSVTFAVATRPSRFPIRPPNVHPSIVNVQIPRSDTEFAGIMHQGNPEVCAPIRERVRENLKVDSVFPFCYLLCFLGMLWFAMAERRQSKLAWAVGLMAVAAIATTLFFDYAENARTETVLQKACEQTPAHTAIEDMTSASLHKWGALGAALLLLGIVGTFRPLNPAGNWYRTYASIGTIAAFLGGICGIGALLLSEPELATLEFNCFSVVTLATLWQALDALSREKDRAA
jgi:hypothetical protein